MKISKQNRFYECIWKITIASTEHQESMEQDLLELNRFKTVLDKDSNNLSIKADEAIKTLQGSSGDIVKLREDIKRIQGKFKLN